MNLDAYFSKIESANSLSRRTGIVNVLLSQWRTGVRQVPFDKCVIIEKATNGLVTRKDLRPADWHLIWPELIHIEKHVS